VTLSPESFFETLKREEVSLHDSRTFEEAEANLSRFIDDVSSRSTSTRVSATGLRSNSRFAREPQD
jgi:hypothetical protein